VLEEKAGFDKAQKHRRNEERTLKKVVILGSAIEIRKRHTHKISYRDAHEIVTNVKIM